MKNKTLTLNKAFSGEPAADKKLEKINTYALTPLADEQVYARRYLMAHNGIDRDVERFSDELLDDFAATLAGKGFFVAGHPSSWGGTGGPGEGRFFNAYTEQLTPEQFKALTGEDIKLPDGMTTVKVLWGESYILRLESNKDTVAKIDAGIYSFVSIGFKAPYVEITDDRGNSLYGEYKSKGEALEGSLVWLGAQPGAMAKHSDKEETKEPKKGGNNIMKEFLDKLKKVFNKAFTEDGVVEEIKTMIDEKDAKIRELSPLADEGKAFRKSLVDDTVRFGMMIDEVPTDADKQKAETDFLATLPIERLKTMRDKFEKSAREKFPDKFTFAGKDTSDRTKTGKEAEHKTATTGKKDYTDPAHNELFATIGK